MVIFLRTVCVVAPDCIVHNYIVQQRKEAMLICTVHSNSRVFLCGLHQSQQSALRDVVKEDVTLDSMFSSVKDISRKVFLQWQEI